MQVHACFRKQPAERAFQKTRKQPTNCHYLTIFSSTYRAITLGITVSITNKDVVGCDSPEARVTYAVGV